jgi:hypothetical protein
MRTLTRTSALAATCLLALGALAGPSGTRNDGRRAVKLTATTEVLGTSVPAGTYDLRWTREPGSETVKLEVAHGKKVLASGQGVWASAESPSPHEALVYRTASGAAELAEIRFRGSADRIVVAAHDDATSSGR